MFNIKEMIEDIREDYVRDESKRDARYALAKLWDNYFDDNPDEEMILYNLIIARFNIESGKVTEGERKCIKNAIDEYENSKDSVKTFLDEDNLNILLEMVSFINSKIK